MTDNPAIRIHVNKIENRITFDIKLSMPETMKLLGSIKNKKNKNKNHENLPDLEITEVAFVHNNIRNSDY